MTNPYATTFYGDIIQLLKLVALLVSQLSLSFLLYTTKSHFLSPFEMSSPSVDPRVMEKGRRLCFLHPPSDRESSSHVIKQEWNCNLTTGMRVWCWWQQVTTASVAAATITTKQTTINRSGSNNKIIHIKSCNSNSSHKSIKKTAILLFIVWYSTVYLYLLGTYVFSSSKKLII